MHLLKHQKKFFILIILGTIPYAVYLFITSSHTKQINQCSLKFFSQFKLQNDKISDFLHSLTNSSLSKYKLWQGSFGNKEFGSGWVAVSRHIFIYSAFIDKCPSKFSYCVKLIGAVLASYSKIQSAPIELKCFLKYEDNHIEISSVIFENIPEDHQRCYTAALFFCPINNSTTNMWPHLASLQDNPSKQIQWIFINHHDQHQLDSNEVKLALCVRPMFGPYSSVVDVGEFVAYYSLLGVDHFIFYNMSTTPDVALFFNILKNDLGINMSLLPWDIPLDDEVIHEWGQLVYIQDCISRSQRKYSHVIMVDFDEYVVTKKHENLKQMLLNADKMYSQAGSYIIPMVLFCTEFDGSQYSKLLLKTQVYTTRQKSVWMHKIRSKVIIKPERTSIGGIHFVWKHPDDIQEIKLPYDFALLHHYKQCCNMEQDWLLGIAKFNVLDDTRVRDQHMLQYKESMEKHEVIKLLFNLSNYTYSS